VRYAERRDAGRYLLVLAAFCLGLMAKPMIVTLPFVLLLLDVWPLGRPRTTALLREKIPLFAVAAVGAVVTYLVQQGSGAVAAAGAYPLGLRVENALVSYAVYIVKVFWPVRLAVFYPYPAEVPVWQAVLAAVALAAISAAVLGVWRSRPWLTVGWLWYLGTLVPVIGLVQVGVQSMADRYTYIPAIGLFIMLAWGVPDLLEGWSRRNWILGGGTALSLSACLLLTHKQVQYWQNGETLFRHVVSATRNNYLAYNNLGFYLENHGKPDEAMKFYEQSVSINPNYEDAQNNIGHLLAA
jgi:tetratricopeptide (TPR) repeat protein